MPANGNRTTSTGNAAGRQRRISQKIKPIIDAAPASHHKYIELSPGKTARARHTTAIGGGDRRG
jgi:hypothetical protein